MHRNNPKAQIEFNKLIHLDWVEGTNQRAYKWKTILASQNQILYTFGVITVISDQRSGQTMNVYGITKINGKCCAES